MECAAPPVGDSNFFGAQILICLFRLSHSFLSNFENAGDCFQLVFLSLSPKIIICGSFAKIIYAQLSPVADFLFLKTSVPPASESWGHTEIICAQLSLWVPYLL